MTATLEAEGLGKKYGQRWALQDCSFALEHGRVTALVGRNGAGKSTMLEMAAGLVRPTAGRVSVCGHDPSREAGKVLPLQGTRVYAWRVDKQLPSLTGTATWTTTGSEELSTIFSARRTLESRR